MIHLVLAMAMQFQASTTHSYALDCTGVPYAALNNFEGCHKVRIDEPIFPVRPDPAMLAAVNVSSAAVCIAGSIDPSERRIVPCPSSENAPELFGDDNPYNYETVWPGLHIEYPAMRTTAHDWAMGEIDKVKKLRAQRRDDSHSIWFAGQSPSWVWIFSNRDDQESFTFDENGTFQADNISEHDALLVMYAMSLQTEIADLKREQAEDRARADVPPPVIKFRGKSFTVQDVDRWSPYIGGDTNCTAKRIRIVATDSTKRVTALHEAMHVATNCTTDETVHRLIQQSAPKLLELLRENPDLVKYLIH